MKRHVTKGDEKYRIGTGQTGTGQTGTGQKFRIPFMLYA